MNKQKKPLSDERLLTNIKNISYTTVQNNGKAEQKTVTKWQASEAKLIGPQP